MKLTYRKSTSRKKVARLKSRARIRKKVEGTSERPRLAVFRSCKNIYAQLIDDNSGKVIASSSTLKMSLKNKSNRDAAKAVGEDVAKKALEKNISSVVFDRSGYVYHGRIEALANSAREAGLKF